MIDATGPGGAGCRGPSRWTAGGVRVRRAAGYSPLLAAALPARRPKLIAMEWLAPATTTG